MMTIMIVTLWLNGVDKVTFQSSAASLSRVAARDRSSLYDDNCLLFGGSRKSSAVATCRVELAVPYSHVPVMHRGFILRALENIGRSLKLRAVCLD